MANAGSELKDTIIGILKEDGRLWNNKKTEFNQRLLFDLISNYDEKIISLLYGNEITNMKFFIRIGKAYVFKNNEFRFFIEENNIFNSYTSYPNRIGLYDGKEFIMDRNSVVINFPFKDCVLEGGQATEEGVDTYFDYDEKVTKPQERQGWVAKSYNQRQDKRKEIFFNEVLAQDEIDRLLDEKAFVNWKRYTKNGIKDVKEIKRDGDGVIRENLIIKGNNLLVLKCLEKQFSNKVKLIFIDPPYYFKSNKDSDAFKYNSNFKLSTWLTFMKNRLTIAKELLEDNGFIIITIGDDGHAYLKVLCDEIFSSDNFVASIAWRKTDNQSNIGQLANVKDNILILNYSWQNNSLP